MSDSVGTKFNRKFYQLQTHVHLRDKTHDFDLKTAKIRVIENKKLYKHILRNAEVLQVHAFQPINTLKETAELLNDMNAHQKLSAIDQVGFENITENLIIPLKQHIEHYDTLQRKIDACHTTRVDMDRYKIKLDRLLKKKRTTRREGQISDMQQRYDMARERYSQQREEIMKDTAFLEEERNAITRPIMTSLLLSYTTYLDNVYSGWKTVRELMNEQPSDLPLIQNTQKAVPLALPEKTPQSQSQPDSQSYPEVNQKQAECLFDYDGDERSLQLREGDIVKIIREDGEWWFGECRGVTGYFPFNYVRVL